MKIGILCYIIVDKGMETNSALGQFTNPTHLNPPLHQCPDSSSVRPFSPAVFHTCGGIIFGASTVPRDGEHQTNSIYSYHSQAIYELLHSAGSKKSCMTIYMIIVKRASGQSRWLGFREGGASHSDLKSRRQ